MCTAALAQSSLTGARLLKGCIQLQPTCSIRHSKCACCNRKVHSIKTAVSAHMPKRRVHPADRHLVASGLQQCDGLTENQGPPAIHKLHAGRI